MPLSFVRTCFALLSDEFSLKTRWRKELEWGVGVGFDRTDMPASIVVWDVCEDSDITDGSFAQMRGGNTRTAGYRVFLFIVKSEMWICVLATNECTTTISLDCRDRRPRRSNVASVTNCTSVYYQSKDNIQKKYIYLLFSDRRGRRSLQILAYAFRFINGRMYGANRYFRDGKPIPYSLFVFFVCRGGVPPPVV